MPIQIAVPTELTSSKTSSDRVTLAQPNANILYFTAAVFGALLAGTVVRLSAAAMSGGGGQSGRDSLKTWWVLTIVVFSAALLGSSISAVLFTAISLFGLHEFLRLSSATVGDRRLMFLASPLVAVHYGAICLGWQAWSNALPVAVLLAASILLVARGETTGFQQKLGHLILGTLLTGFCLSYAVKLLCLPSSTNPTAGNSGWFLFLIVLTELNDISQALVGRRWGRRKIAPTVSPNKSWAGFLGGLVVTTTLATLIGPWLTPFPSLQAAMSGALIALAGFAGDLNLSAVKRDAGVKDSSNWLPGQGGFLDRIDSLTFTAPVFFYYIQVSTT